MKTPASLIVFATEQAIEAEVFGFSRNECCRNLKTALHQYRQNKAMGLHGQSQKKRISRSVAAKHLPLKQCVVEHTVPLMHIVNMLMELTDINEDRVVQILEKYYHITLVTKDEDGRLNASGLRSRMPAAWDGIDMYARYHAVGIAIEI